MINYYVELGLDRSLTIEELKEKLHDLKKKHTKRASSAATGEKRREHERILDLIREATSKLLDKDAKRKYDKDLDKAPSASRAESSPQQQGPVSVDSSQASTALIDLVQQFYESGNYAQAIAVAMKAIATDNVSVDLFRILALCYVESGDENGAFNTLQHMLQTYADDVRAHFLHARLCLSVLSNHTQYARESIDWLIEKGVNEVGLLVALDVEYDLIHGDKNLADQKIDEYLSHHGDDQEFRQSVCRALAQYADAHKLTEYGGDGYFENEANLKDWLALYERAIQIYPDDYLQAQYNHAKELTSKKFLPENLLGILCGIFYAAAGLAANPGLGILLVIFAVAMVAYSSVPKWQLVRFQYTGHLVGLYEGMRILNIIASFYLRFCWWVVMFILRIMFGMFLR